MYKLKNGILAEQLKVKEHKHARDIEKLKLNTTKKKNLKENGLNDIKNIMFAAKKLRKVMPKI